MTTLTYQRGIEESVLQLDSHVAGLPEYVVNNPLEIGGILNAIDSSPYYAIDVETTSLNYKRGQLHGVSLAVEDREWYVFGNAVIPTLQGLNDIHYHQPKKGVIGHNLKFDLHWLKRFGYRPQFIADTMIAQNLVDENLDAGLKDLAGTRLGIPDLPDFKDMLKNVPTKYTCNKCGVDDIYDEQGKCPYCGKKLIMVRRKLEDMNILDIPLPTLVKYAAKDTRLTFDLWKVLANDLKREGMWNMFHNKSMPFLYVLLDMEESGMYIDQELVASLKEEFTAEAEKARATFERLSGGVNPNSSQQLSKLLFETMGLPVQHLTKSGNYSTDALVLQRLAPLDTTGTVAALKTVKTYEKLLSTYINSFQNDVWVDRRIYGNFNQDGTVTGRLSCSNPNLQNIPSRGELGHRIREVFAAQSEGNVILVADYSQLELRLVAHFSGEPRMVEAFLKGDDPHQITADMIGVSRSVGKTLNFGTVYGQGPKTMCDTIEKSGKERPKETDAKEWLKQYDAAYPVLKRWKWGQVEYAREHQFVTTIGGRKRRLPDINSWDSGLRSRAERQSYNAPIQGSAADVAQEAMLDIHPFLDWYGANMLAQVHDELVFEVPSEAAEEFGQIVKEKMIGVGDKFGLRVALEADPGIGRSWGAAKK